jgi:hypothetical protein
MNESSGPRADLSSLEGRIGELARAVRRQVIALWSLIVILVLAYGAPWVMFFVRSIQFPDTTGIPAAEAESAEPIQMEERWDNDFHARPPEEKIKRASAILLTRLEKDGDRHREIVAEILKRKPGVRLYYKVGDEYEMLSHAPTPECTGCEGQGSIVFMIGNPATMVSSVTYDGDRLRSMGDIPLDEIRRLAAESVPEQP